MVTVPASMLAGIRADAMADRDRAKGTAALLAPPGSPEYRAGRERAERWAALHPGMAALLDWAAGGGR